LTTGAAIGNAGKWLDLRKQEIMFRANAHLGAVEQDRMYKLCSLKEIVPGSVVELPKKYQSKAGETAIVLELAYHANGKDIAANLWRPDAPISFPAQSENAQLALVEDKALQKTATQAFVSSKLALPELGMSLGCDPEVFCVHEDDSVFPAWEFMPSEEEAQAEAKQWLKRDWEYFSAATPEVTVSFPGAAWARDFSNRRPLRVPAYWDGAQAEFAPWAKQCMETLHESTRLGLIEVLTRARKVDPKAKLTLQNVVTLPEAVLQNADAKFIQFRCSQSLNIYNDPGDGIQDARKYKYRCAGGHIHIGYTRAFTAPGIEQVVRGLDGVLGVIGVSLAAGIDNPERRHTYGRAGEFRLPRHGLEYRVLSNFWLSHPAIAMLVFELSRSVVRLAESGLFNLCWTGDEEETREVINNCDVAGARKIIRRNAAVLTGLLKGTWGQSATRSEVEAQKMRTLALRTILHGIDVAVKDPLDIEGNWKINHPELWGHYCHGKENNWQDLATRKTSKFL
jgi:Phage phiEco32-like COOH.NH2 ligase-type 2